MSLIVWHFRDQWWLMRSITKRVVLQTWWIIIIIIWEKWPYDERIVHGKKIEWKIKLILSTHIDVKLLLLYLMKLTYMMLLSSWQGQQQQKHCIWFCKTKNLNYCSSVIWVYYPKINILFGRSSIHFLRLTVYYSKVDCKAFLRKCLR